MSHLYTSDAFTESPLREMEESALRERIASGALLSGSLDSASYARAYALRPGYVPGLKHFGEWTGTEEDWTGQADGDQLFPDEKRKFLKVESKVEITYTYIVPEEETNDDPPEIIPEHPWATGGPWIATKETNRYVGGETETSDENDLYCPYTGTHRRTYSDWTITANSASEVSAYCDITYEEYDDIEEEWFTSIVLRQTITYSIPYTEEDFFADLDALYDAIESDTFVANRTAWADWLDIVINPYRWYAYDGNGDMIYGNSTLSYVGIAGYYIQYHGHQIDGWENYEAREGFGHYYSAYSDPVYPAIAINHLGPANTDFSDLLVNGGAKCSTWHHVSRNDVLIRTVIADLATGTESTESDTGYEFYPYDPDAFSVADTPEENILFIPAPSSPHDDYRYRKKYPVERS